MTDSPIIRKCISLNRRDRLRVEIVERRGSALLNISRWKLSADGEKRTGQVFEINAVYVDELAAELRKVADKLGGKHV